jgi:hypothetical protein
MSADMGGDMRLHSLRSKIIAVVIAASANCIGCAITSFAAEAGSDLNASCRIPFEQLKDPKTGEPFPLSTAYNEGAKLPANLRQRYIVADLNSADENGNCRGVQEYFTPVGELSDFPRLQAIAMARKMDIALLTKESLESLLVAEGPLLASEDTPSDAPGLALELEDLRNYLDQVHRYKTDPVVKPPVVNGYCVGQTLSFCEIVDGQPKLIYRFVTSSSRSTPPLYRYYAPVNFINTRHWSSDRRYTPADVRRDARMGGGDAIPIPFANGGNPIEMPNFMNFLPMPGYTGETLNGIHEIAGGLDSGGTFGAPVSLGCIRLNKYQAKLARWWTPRQAKFFMHFEPNRYRNFGDPVTSKARGFQAPRGVEIEAAAAERRPENRIAAKAENEITAVTRSSSYRALPSRPNAGSPAGGSDVPFIFFPFASFLPP